MKKVSWIDSSGFKHTSLLRDNDPDSNAANGVLVGPPDTRRLDWDTVAKELNNALFDNGILTSADLGEKNSQFTGAILSAVRRRLIELYRGGK